MIPKLAPKAVQVVQKRALGLIIANLKPPSTLFLSLEGRGIGSDGTIAPNASLDFISLFQRRDGPSVFASRQRQRSNVPEPSKLVSDTTLYVLNMVKLRSQAWEAADASGLRRSLRSVLQSNMHTKVVWSARHTAKVLYTLFGVRLGEPVVDLELMMSTAYPNAPGDSNTLDMEAAMARDGRLRPEVMDAWRAHRDAGLDLYLAEDVFAPSKLRREIIEHAGNNVRGLPSLYATYCHVLSEQQQAAVRDKSVALVAETIREAGTPRMDVFGLENQRMRKAEQRQKQLKREEKRAKKMAKREGKLAQEKLERELDW
jgi:hypothetical protein